MKAHKFDGYNLDVELGGTAADALFYTKFVSEFADALHKEGGLLSSDSECRFSTSNFFLKLSLSIHFWVDTARGLQSAASAAARTTSA
jgi:hypothetical protein